MSPPPGQPAWPFPGVVWGDYPEQPLLEDGPELRRHARPRALNRFADAAAAVLVPAEDLARRLRALPELAADPQAWMLEAMVLAAAAFAQRVGYAPNRQQLLAARILLDDCLAEMATGEGKTAAIALAAAVAALARTPVHVVTANDYLALRDSTKLRPFFDLLGLRVACVTQPLQAAQRREAYRADVTYCTAKELAFDYLRDGLARAADLSPLEQRARRLGDSPSAQPPVLRGLCMAILDEADTVLIDEARVPLVIAQDDAATGEAAFHRDALAQARKLEDGQHFRLLPDGRRFQLTAAGRQLLPVQWPAADHPLLGHRAHREAAVEQALAALHVLRRDHEYVVRNGKVMLVDETTGRTAEGRAWSAGLHQLVEWKEGVAATSRNATVNQVTFQRFFPRYLRLAGTSGTLGEARGELRQVYGLDLVVVPPRTPSRVQRLPGRVFADSTALWHAVAQEARAMVLGGQAVLIGTDTVAQSESLSQVLVAQALPHRVLNARQDQEESRLIAAAGEPGRITVATSMAGRGTDIACAPQVLERGGLHVILCQVNASPRIDRQFMGRAGRQGQPGSLRRMVALDFPLVRRWWPNGWLQWITGSRLVFVLGNATIWLAQRRESFTQRYQRVKLGRVADSEERDLTFTRKVQHAKR